MLTTAEQNFDPNYYGDINSLNETNIWLKIWSAHDYGFKLYFPHLCAKFLPFARKVICWESVHFKPVNLISPYDVIKRMRMGFFRLNVVNCMLNDNFFPDFVFSLFVLSFCCHLTNEIFWIVVRHATVTLINETLLNCLDTNRPNYS